MRFYFMFNIVDKEPFPRLGVPDQSEKGKFKVKEKKHPLVEFISRLNKTVGKPGETS